MDNPEAALVRAVFALARACAGADPVRLSFTLADRRRWTIELPPHPPARPPAPPAAARMLSPDAERVVEMLTREGASSAKAVMLRLGIDKNRTYYILDDLTARGVIVSTADGYAAPGGVQSPEP